MNVGGGVVMVIGQSVTMVMVGGGVVTWYCSLLIINIIHESPQYLR